MTPTAIEKVVQNEGQEEEKVLYAAPREEGEQVIDPEVARKATEVMIGDVTQGIAYKAALGDRSVAGKTGTSENFFDSWFMGFTPQLVTGVWMGYEEGGSTLDGLLNIGGRQLGPFAPPPVIWRDYMQKVLQDKPAKKFDYVDAPQTLSTSTTGSAGTPKTGSAIGEADPASGGALPGSVAPFPFPNQPGGVPGAIGFTG